MLFYCSIFCFFFFFFKQKTAYEMRISDWSSDVCSSDLRSSAAGEIGACCSRPIASAACVLRDACPGFRPARLLRMRMVLYGRKKAPHAEEPASAGVSKHAL